MGPVVVDGLPEAFAGLVLAAASQMTIEDLEVEWQVVGHPVPIPVGEDEASDVVGMDDRVLKPAAHRDQRRPWDLQTLDQLGLAIEGNGVSREDLGLPGEQEAEAVAAEDDGVHGRGMHDVSQGWTKVRWLSVPALPGWPCCRCCWRSVRTASLTSLVLSGSSHVISGTCQQNPRYSRKCPSRVPSPGHGRYFADFADFADRFGKRFQAHGVYHLILEILSAKSALSAKRRALTSNTRLLGRPRRVVVGTRGCAFGRMKPCFSSQVSVSSRSSGSEK